MAHISDNSFTLHLLTFFWKCRRAYGTPFLTFRMEGPPPWGCSNRFFRLTSSNRPVNGRRSIFLPLLQGSRVLLWDLLYLIVKSHHVTFQICSHGSPDRADHNANTCLVASSTPLNVLAGNGSSSNYPLKEDKISDCSLIVLHVEVDCLALRYITLIK